MDPIFFQGRIDAEEAQRIKRLEEESKLVGESYACLAQLVQFGLSRGDLAPDEIAEELCSFQGRIADLQVKAETFASVTKVVAEADKRFQKFVFQAVFPISIDREEMQQQEAVSLFLEANDVQRSEMLTGGVS